MPQSAVLAVSDLQQRIRSPGSLSGRRIIKQMRLAFLREEGSTRLSNDPSSLSLCSVPLYDYQARNHSQVPTKRNRVLRFFERKEARGSLRSLSESLSTRLETICQHLEVLVQLPA